MRKRVLVVALSCAAILGFCTAHASAVPIHHHYTVHKTVLIPKPNRIGKTPVKVTLHRVEKYDVAPAPAPVVTTTTTTASAPSTTTTSSGGWSSVPGVPASFAACVAMAESTNGTNPAAGGNVYGILDPVPGTDPVADPKGAFAALYAQAGAAAWSPYDGC